MLKTPFGGLATMINVRALATSALAIILSTLALHGQDRSRYRDFPLGATVASISNLAGVDASAAKPIHLRPALMQELEWQRPYSLSGTTPAAMDPVSQIVFCFYENQLSKMVIDYDRHRTAGMTDADVIDALTTQYGPPVKGVKTNRATASQVEQESGTPIARWGDVEYSVVLYRSSYEPAFRVIVTSPRLEALARTADAKAVRLDEREAPAREIARQKKEADDERASEEKSRVANKAAFRP